MTKTFLSKRIDICCECFRDYSKCPHSNCIYISTSKSNWERLKKKYKYKFLGGYRLKRYIKSQFNRINQNK